ncbi:MAG: T9SS type A sorting domain-containing protein [Bacteroidia bacterium]
MKNLYIPLILLGLFGLTKAQDVRLSYSVDMTETGTTLSVFAESTSESSFDLAALNASIVYGDGCEAVGKMESVLEESWTDYLAQTHNSEALSLQYNSQTFSKRLQWGLADPGLPQTSAVILPPAGDPVLVLEQKFLGACQTMYLEHVSENSLNELGNTDMTAVEYEIQHPQRVAKEDFTFELTAFPNPTADWLSVSSEKLEAGTYIVGVYDLLGNLVREESHTIERTLEFKIDMRTYASGVYFVSIKHADKPVIASAKRVVKI